nr:udp-glycosyltransferase 83a1 [Quercus suber]
MDSNISLVSIPDGLGPEDDRNELGKLCESMLHTMPKKLEELINYINASNGDDKISCIVTDVGIPAKRQVIQPLPGMPAMDTAYIPCFNPTQFQELALGLELTNRPFLWVVRPDIVDRSRTSYTNEFHGTRGKIVGWAPQSKVLNHPAIACFICHCGWNSTIEGVSSGVPFLCWPYFTDQFLDQLYICDVWKVGQGFELDENGIVLQEEVKRKVDQLLGDESIRARSLELKKILMNNIADNGQSSKNFNDFIQWLKE